MENGASPPKPGVLGRAVKSFFWLCLAGMIGVGRPTLADAGTGETIAHEILRAEYEAKGGTDDDYTARLNQLNSIVDLAVERIKALRVDESTPEGIKKLFSEVDQVLVDKHYHVFIQTETLWDALTPGIPASGGRHVLTPKMEEHRQRFPDATYYRFDCDTGTIIHLGVFERLGKPVVMVETPKHNFLRWRISPHQHVNWDVNDSESYTDDQHRAGAPRTTSGFDDDTEKKGHYLLDMPRDEVRCYHLAIVAGLFKEGQQFAKAIDCYHESIECRPYAATPKNNLAWMIATQPSLQRKELLDHALTMARSAVELRPKDGNLIDTLAAIHAARHEFDEAIAVEESGRNNPSRIKAYLDHKTPVEMDWKLEPDG
jgi:hypothetical protein